MKKIIGVDLGGTGVSAGLFDLEGNMLKVSDTPSMGHIGDKNLVFKKIRQVINNVIDDSVVAIGLGTPGFVDIEKGKTLSIGGNIKNWEDTNIKDILEEYYNIPVIVGNDANVAAACEAWIGAGKDLDNFVMITLGTGLGGGVYKKDFGLLYGHHYEGAELGHSILYPKGRKCDCGQIGCVERYVSGTALELNYEELTGKYITGEEIFDNFENDSNAQKSVEKFSHDLSIFLMTIKNIFDPEAVIIGGGVINSKDYWWDDMISYYNKNVNHSGKIKFLPAKYLNDSGKIGAAKIALDRLKL